ncbi:enolase-phosphatase E1-like isoform X2 [Belonocnema kinseyi]|uniref:enolase-phosphatase E1-like isoform X2 n=1 Tax=Belonocnema kinseyi TaxID=2817044 RepID=UPI00143CDC40|nr:enolase-phosphatase E1-like isoform X2 [Belonocnema kinseyi]
MQGLTTAFLLATKSNSDCLEWTKFPNCAGLVFSSLTLSWSGNDTASQKSPEHAVKVQFAREFADVKATPSVADSLSSASSFQSLSSTLSSKSSNGICADSVLGSPAKFADTSYVNSDIPGLDDLIAACADIKITERGEQVNLQAGLGDLSQDQTFTSAADDFSIAEEEPEEESPKPEEVSILNGTFEVDSSAAVSLQDPSLKLEDISAPEFCSLVPYVSFGDSVLKTHALHSVNKDSLVFSSALELTKVDELTSESTNEEKSCADTNDPQNVSLPQSDSSKEEFHFNASIEKQKNDSAGSISINKSTDAPLERTESTTIPFLLNTSNVSGILEKDKSVDNVRAISPNTEPASSEEISQCHLLDYSVPVASDESHIEGSLNLSNQELEIKSQIILPVSPQIPKENSKEISLSQANTVVSSFAIISEQVKPQASGETVQKTKGSEGILKDTNQYSKKRARSESPVLSPIPQSILDKVAQQQKSLDATFELVLEESQVEVKRPCSRTSDLEEGLENNLNLSTVIETLPQSESFVPSPVLCEPSMQQKVLDSTVVITAEDDLETESIAANAKEILNTSGQIPKEQEIAGTPLSKVVSPQTLEQRTLESTLNISDESGSESIPKIKVSSPEKSSEDSTLKNSNTQSNSLNSTVNTGIQESTPVKALKNDFQSEISHTEISKSPVEQDKVNEETKEVTEDIESIVKFEVEDTIDEACAPVELNSTVILEGSEIDLEESNATALRVQLTQEANYDTFKPQQQSTDLAFGDPSIFDKVELEAQAVAKEIYDRSLELVEDHEQFVSATSELFQDPAGFDFLLSQGSSNNRARDLRFESLYVKFDPLVNKSMLPQGNTQTEDEEQNGKIETPVPSVDTPKRNPAIAAIDRLLFYSPITSMNNTPEAKDIKEAAETPPQDTAPVVDEKMAKELELVRSLVVQLEEKLEKIEKDREEDTKKYQKEIKKQQEEYAKLEQKNSKLEAQIAQEIESKKQVTVVLDEYERSISRLVAERERDRADLEEKAKMKEELQAANQHLSNTEAAFNDVHQKYERLKGVVAAYKSNESVLKESVQENVETIKALENRYEQLKSHAMAQLEKANQELETIRKQNEGETVKLQAMLKKAELKSKSLTDLVEQKTKENKELTQILDEVIARVGSQNTD